MMERWLFNKSHFCIAEDGDFSGLDDTCYWGLPSIQASDPAYPVSCRLQRASAGAVAVENVVVSQARSVYTQDSPALDWSSLTDCGVTHSSRSVTGEATSGDRWRS